MAMHANGSRILALVGLFALVGCGAKDGENGGLAAGGTQSRAAGGATAGARAFGGSSSGGSFGVGAAASGGSATTGIGGVGGTGNAGAPALGPIGVGGVGAGGTNSTMGSGIPTDPACAGVLPVDGASCDPHGPMLCPAAKLECVCLPPDDNGAPKWSCFDLDSSSGIGFGIGGAGDTSAGGLSTGGLSTDLSFGQGGSSGRK